MPSKHHEYFQVENSQSILETSTPAHRGELLVFYLRFDKQYDNYERIVFSFGDFFENIGGFYSGIIAIGMILVPFFSERLFYSSLIKNIY